ncbi:NUDIX domain-containing protein [bacterium]|nr:NUDIX domain-containing protein [bacterium]
MEFFDILDDEGNITGCASRQECHSGTRYLHRVVHVLVFDTCGRLYLQKRSQDKDIEPGKWDTSVGGHIMSGEMPEDALIREAEEELGITGTAFECLYTYIMETDIERELVFTFRCTWEGTVRFHGQEIEEVCPFDVATIGSLLGSGCFTPHFEEEWRRYSQWTDQNGE